MVKKVNNENGLAVYNYVKAHENENVTAAEIAEAIDLPVKTVNGIITMTFQRNRDADKNIVPLMERVVGEIEQEDGSHKSVKFIKLTAEGRAAEVSLKD